MRMYLRYWDEGTELTSEISKPSEASLLSFPDRWILACLYQFSITYEENIRSCKFHLVTEAIRTFFYAQYCDIYLVIHIK
jgi:valyl-tRNA synthetase